MILASFQLTLHLFGKNVQMNSVQQLNVWLKTVKTTAQNKSFRESSYQSTSSWLILNGLIYQSNSTKRKLLTNTKIIPCRLNMSCAPRPTQKTDCSHLSFFISPFYHPLSCAENVRTSSQMENGAVFLPKAQRRASLRSFHNKDF